MATESEPFAAHGRVSKVLQQEAGHGSHWGVLENPVKKRQNHDPRTKSDRWQKDNDKAELKSALVEQKDFLTPIVQEAVQTILELEMEECSQAGRHERNAEQAVCRSG